MDLARISADDSADLAADMVPTVALAVSPWTQNLADWAVQDRGTPYQRLDRRLHGYQAKLTGGLSPMALWSAMFDWAGHMANSPFRRVELAVDGLARLGNSRLSRWGRTRPRRPRKIAAFRVPDGRARLSAFSSRASY